MTGFDVSVMMSAMKLKRVFVGRIAWGLLASAVPMVLLLPSGGCGAVSEGQDALNDSDGARMVRGMQGLPDGGLMAIDDGGGAGDSARDQDAPVISLDGPVGGVDGSPDASPREDAPAQPDTSPDSPPSACSPGGLCDSIEKDYQAAVARAKACDPSIKGQCLHQVPSSLRCGCKVWTNHTSETDILAARWEKAECNLCRRVCPLVLCRVLTDGVCKSTAIAAEPLAILPPAARGTCENAAVIASP
jgi:hypothetical protein